MRAVGWHIEVDDSGFPISARRTIADDVRFVQRAALLRALLHTLAGEYGLPSGVEPDILPSKTSWAELRAPNSSRAKFTTTVGGVGAPVVT